MRGPRDGYVVSSSARVEAARDHDDPLADGRVVSSAGALARLDERLARQLSAREPLYAAAGDYYTLLDAHAGLVRDDGLGSARPCDGYGVVVGPILARGRRRPGVGARAPVRRLCHLLCGDDVHILARRAATPTGGRRPGA